MKLIVVRHGLTVGNEKELFIGQYDDVLSAAGKKSLPKLVETLHDADFSAAYSSPLQRTLHTALPLAEDHGLKLQVDPRIIEVNVGEFTMKPRNATLPVLRKSSTDLLDSYQYDFTRYGGESAEQVKRRVREFLTDLRKSNSSSVLIVTHGGIIRWFYLLLNGSKVSRFPNTSQHFFEL